MSEESQSEHLRSNSGETLVESQECHTLLHEFPPLFSCNSLLELAKSSWCRSSGAPEEIQPYLRGCKWSPDGTCCLTIVNNDGMHLCELPRDLYDGSASEDRTVDVMDSAVHVKEAGLVYDFCWYPLMNSSYPETCCWLSTMQNSPIQMWDAFDGSLRCSYRSFNSFDEMEPAIAVTFTSEPTKIIAGHRRYLRTFEVERPGRECVEHKITSPATCFAVASNLLAVGSWNSSISLYSIKEMGTYKSIGKMYGHSAGVTHVKFTSDGSKLVSGARKDNKLLVWDIRYYRKPLKILTRTVDTNQRIYFDISPCEKYLCSGGTDGIATVWQDWSSGAVTEGDEKALKFPLYKDSCNSISIHPLRQIIATGSGQHHHEDPLAAIDPEESFANHDVRYSNISENSLTFWWIGDV